MTVYASNLYWKRRSQEVIGYGRANLLNEKDVIEMERFESPDKYKTEDFDKAMVEIGICRQEGNIVWRFPGRWNRIKYESESLESIGGSHGGLLWCSNDNFLVFMSSRMVRFRDLSLMVYDEMNGKRKNRIDSTGIECVLFGTDFVYMIAYSPIKGLKAILEFEYA